MVLVGVLAACHAAAPPQPAEAARPQLVTEKGKLYLLQVPEGTKRGALYLIDSHETILGTRDREHVGLVRGLQTHGSSLAVVELCRLPADERDALVHGGLPAVPLVEDKRARVGKCLAMYELHPEAWQPDRAWVDLRLDLGHGDGVREGDRYEVQGQPFVDSINQSVTGYESLGECTIQGPPTNGYSTCRLDKRQSLTREQLSNGRYAVFKEDGEAQASAPGAHSPAPS